VTERNATEHYLETNRVSMAMAQLSDGRASDRSFDAQGRRRNSIMLFCDSECRHRTSELEMNYYNRCMEDP
jgi:hypothetical protein